MGLFGATSSHAALPPTVVDDLEGAVQIAGSDSINCALLDDGTVTCCPHTDGMVITDGGVCRPVPLLTGVVHIAAASGHACAIILDGTVWCWGHNNDGTVGPDIGFVERPIRIDGVHDALELATGYAHACARRADRTILCWGKNDEGQLGVGTTDGRVHAPEMVVLAP